MTISLLGITVVLMLTGAVLIVTSFRRHGHEAALTGMTGMTAMVAGAIPALVYAGITS
jgi:hypothetical protein